jgi:hypothetical protein
MLLTGAAKTEETACSTQADNSSRKLRLRCGCQFPWCALGLKKIYSMALRNVLLGRRTKATNIGLDQP